MDVRAKARPGNPVPPSAYALLRAALARDLPMLAISGLCGVALSTTVALYAYLAGPLLGIAFQTTRDGGGFPSWIPVAAQELLTEPETAAQVLAAGLIAVTLARAALSYAHSLLTTRLHRRVGRRLRSDVLAHLLNASPLALGTRSVGDVTRLVGHDIQVVGQAVQLASGTLLLHMLRALVLVGAAFHINPHLAWLLVAALPAATLWLRWQARRVRRAWHSVYDAQGRLAGDLTSIVAMVPTLQLTGRQRAAREHLTRRVRQVDEAALQAARMDAWTSPVLQVVGTFAVASVLWIGASTGELDGPRVMSWVSFLTAVALLFRSAQTLSVRTVQLTGAAAALDRIQGLLAVPPRDTGAGRPVPASPSSVRLRGVGFSYGARAVLTGIDLDIKPGESVAIVGPSGSGKTTLLRLLAGLLDGYSGSVQLGGIELHDADVASWQHHFAWVDQAPHVLPDTVESNITLWEDQPDRKRLQRAVDRAGATRVVEALPRGYQERLSEHGAPLSGGEQQRLCIARALYREPHFLLLDEPTSALDPTAERELTGTLEALLSSTTSVLVSHRLSTVTRARRVVVLEGGRVVEQGPPRQLWQAGGAFRTLFDDQPWPVHDERHPHAETA